MLRISKSNKMTWIHQFCSLAANYKSQGRPNLWVSDTRTSMFEVSGHPRNPQWLRYWLGVCANANYPADVVTVELYWLCCHRHTDQINADNFSHKILEVLGCDDVSNAVSPLKCSDVRWLYFKLFRVQSHPGLTYIFLFLTFGHSGAQPWAPKCQNVRN